jgi:hypothetical protein
MKGTVSPELRAIFRDPEMRKNFINGFFASDRKSNHINIDLGNNQNISITRFSAPNPTGAQRKKRNIFEILIGR